MPAAMTTWTLRLVACAGLVALLGRLPDGGSVGAAFAAGLAGALVLLGALAAGTALAGRARRAPHPAESPTALAA